MVKESKRPAASQKSLLEMFSNKNAAKKTKTSVTGEEISSAAMEGDSTSTTEGVSTTGEEQSSVIKLPKASTLSS